MKKAKNIDGMGRAPMGLPSFTDWPAQARRPPPEIEKEVDALTLPATERFPDSGVNIIHMHRLVDAVEGGQPTKWRAHPISREELEAAYRATGRTPATMREPGEDREEDGA